MVQTRARDYGAAPRRAAVAPAPSLESIQEETPRPISPPARPEKPARITPEPVSKLKFRIPPTSHPVSYYMKFECPTGCSACLWADGCFCVHGEETMRAMFHHLEERTLWGETNRYALAALMMMQLNTIVPTRESFAACSYDEQQEDLCRLQISCTRRSFLNFESRE